MTDLRLLALVGLALAAGVLLVLPARAYLLVDAYPTTFVRPPTPYTASSVARGLSLYGAHCRVCHGPAGRGSEVAAATLGVAPADLASWHTRIHTPGDVVDARGFVRAR